MKSEQWSVKKLGELCKIGDGNHSSKYPKKSEMVEMGIPFIRGTNLVNGRISDDNMRYITEEKHSTLKKGHLRQGDVLFTNRGEVGKVAIVDERFDNANLNSQLAWFRCGEEITPEFLFYYLQTSKMKRYFSQSKTGAALQQFTITMIKSVLISYPSIEEQRRIVKILDESLGDIELNSSQIKKSINDSHKLFEATLNEIFSNFNDTWSIAKLKEITAKIGSGATPKGGKKSYKSEGISLIRSMNVHDKFFKLKDLAFIDESQAEKLSNVVVESNDVLLNITGASVARCNLAPQEIIPARVNQHVIIIRPFSEKLDPKFLHFLLISKPFKDKLLVIGEQGGTTRQAITKKQVENFEIRYPSSMQEQKDIINRITSLLKKSDKLENTYFRKLDSISELKQSILQEAFNGNLAKEIAA